MGTPVGGYVTIDNLTLGHSWTLQHARLDLSVNKIDQL